MFDIWKQIKKKQFSPIYLLYGEESFLINETKHLLIEHVLGDGGDFDLSTYDLEETEIEIALEDAETLPFMGERRLIILNHPYFLTTEKGKIEHNVKKLEAYLKEPSPFSIVVFTGYYEKLDERKKITKLLKQVGTVFHAKKLTEKELIQWIETRVHSEGMEIEREAIELLLTLTGTDLSLLSSEVEKLLLYSSTERKIEAQMVEKLVARTLEQNIFTLVDKVVHRKIDDALSIYYDLLKQNEEPIKLLAIITGQFRLIYQVKELARKGYGQQKIASLLKVHPFRVKLAAGQAKLFSEEELVEIMKMLAEGDLMAKTSGMDKKLIIEMILFRIYERAQK